MSYLLIDLEKPTIALHHLSEQAGAVYLFTKRKRKHIIAKQFAKQHLTAKAMRCAKHKRLSDCLIKKLKHIVQSKPQAHIVVASHGKRVARKLNQLLNQYPDTHVILLDKKQKKTKLASLHHAVVDVPQESSHAPIITAEPLLLNKPADIPLLDAPKDKGTAEQINTVDKEWQNIHQAIVLLKKNRPRKKATLVEALCHALRLTSDDALELIAQLEGLNVIDIDIAENVRYR